MCEVMQQFSLVIYCVYYHHLLYEALTWSGVVSKWPPEKRHHRLLLVSPYIGMQLHPQDHHQSDQVGKDGAKEDDDKGAVNKLIRGRCLGSVTRIDLMKQPGADS